jgi:hypothetical protein
MKRVLILGAVVVAVALWAGVATAGEYHVGPSLVCSDCHTMHYSRSHDFTGDVITPGSFDSLAAGGPFKYLLKADGTNSLCLACHDGQTYAPDVLGANSSGTPADGRQAGALNRVGVGGGYDEWKGHTLGETGIPPGFEPTLVGANADAYDPAGGLKCTSCHLNHGIAAAYRNLGPRRFASSGNQPNFRPTYVISETNDTTKDVWVKIAPGTYSANSGSSATFDPFYATANIFFNRNDATVGSVKTSNRMGTFCAACHANFHGGPGDAQIKTSAGDSGFVRHPTAQVSIGDLQPGGHSSLPRYVGATTKVKVTTNDYAAYTQSAPMCLSCHKAHGNQNPFGLIFLSRAATAVTEEGGWAAADTQDTPTGLRNLCGQCHVQGN